MADSEFFTIEYSVIIGGLAIDSQFRRSAIFDRAFVIPKFKNPR